MDVEKEVEIRLKQNFPGGKWEIDFSDGHHMGLEISDLGFAGKTLVDQHKMVYAALDDLIKNGWLHALKLKTKI